MYLVCDPDVELLIAWPAFLRVFHSSFYHVAAACFPEDGPSFRGRGNREHPESRALVPFTSVAREMGLQEELRK
jgi:hypothetical protein